MKALSLLVLAALLEVGGDALIRHGLKGRGVAFIIAGVVVLTAYGFMVNLSNLDFGHLMGLYIVLFFIVSQLVAVLIFREPIHTGIYLGGGLVIAGGIVMTLWPK